MASINFIHADFVQSVIGPTQTITYHFYTESRTAEVVGYEMVTGSVVIPEQVLWADIYYTVKAIGDSAFVKCKYLTSIAMPDLLERIGNHAFDGCLNLTDITFPFNRLKSIGDYAFKYCSSLTSLTIPNSVTSIGEHAFWGCSSLTSVTIPNSVKSIGEYAFALCSSLTSVTIPNGVKSIGEAAFSCCSSLTSVTIPNGIISIEEYTFQDCTSLTSLTIPNSVTSIEEFAFRNCSSLTSVHISDIAAWLAISFANPLYYAYNLYLNGTLVTDLDIPNSVTSIRNHAFYNCSSLTSVTIPGSVTSIGDYAFFKCSGLTSVTIPNSVISIGNYAFEYCSGLTSVTIPGSVTTIGMNSFRDCTGLTSIVVESGNTTYDSRNNCNAIIETSTNTLIAGCMNTIIPNSVTSIGSVAFAGCSSLTSIEIPNSVTSIGSVAFAGCSSLTSIEIPNSVTSIGEHAFYGCTGLTSIEIPNSVTSIGMRAFMECINLDSLVFESETPATLGADAFANTNDCPLVVPCSAVDAYKTAWPDYADRITCSGSGSQGITVRLDPQSCADWSVVRLWAWTSEGNLFDAWPGIVVSQDADGWYSYTFDESVESVNIIWTDGTNQTVNIEGVTASTCYALNSTSGKTITASVVDCGSTASNYYTIRFLNWDGTVLQNSQVKEGELPSYTGTTPVRPADEQYTYSFSGWSPAIATATADADYTAQFTATEKTTDPSIPTVQDLSTAGYDVANKVVLCLYFDDAPCYDVVIAGTYMADEAGSWITDPEQLVHMAALESFEGWYAAEIPYSSNAQGKPIQLKSNGAFSWEYQSGDADAWIKRGGEGSQTAAIVAGYNNEADVYYPAPGCYIYELAYWKNHNNPCVIIPTHNYTIHLYAPDACEEMKPAIIGNFNNWTTGVAMSETTDEQGKKMYTITIADEEGKAFKFRDAAYDNWSNELQEFLEGYRVWSTFSNFVLPAVTADTTIVFDFSDNSKYRFKLCEKVEDVVVWLKVPTGAPGYYNGAIEMVVYSADEPTAMPLQYNQEDELWSVELQAKGSNYFFVREANSEGNYILNYTHYYYSDGSDEYVWSTWGTTFQYYWEDGTGDFTGSKIIMLDISNPSYYKWDVPAIGTGIEDIQGDDVQCTKVIRNGQIYILRGDKTYTLQGQEVK